MYSVQVINALVCLYLILLTLECFILQSSVRQTTLLDCLTPYLNTASVLTPSLYTVSLISSMTLSSEGVPGVLGVQGDGVWAEGVAGVLGVQGDGVRAHEEGVFVDEAGVEGGYGP